MGPATPFVMLVAAMGGFDFFRRFGRGDWSDTGGVTRSWLESFPGDQVQDSVVSLDRRAALVSTAWGAGLMYRGGRFARRLDRATVESDPQGLRIQFEDITCPVIRVKLSPHDAAVWHERIESD